MFRLKYTAAFALVTSLSLTAAPSVFSAQHGQQAQQDQQQGQKGGQISQEVENVIKNWKEQPRKVAHEMIQKYGKPQEIAEQRLVWHDNGPWKRTELINEEIEHKFPMPHKDMLMQVVSYQVPSDKFDDLAEYDGSVIAERTRGELAARCDKEAANFLAVNLAHDIVTGKRSVEEARKMYGEQIVAFASGKSVPMMEKLMFEPQKDAGDPGKTTLDESTIKEVKQAMKDK